MLVRITPIAGMVAHGFSFALCLCLVGALSLGATRERIAAQESAGGTESSVDASEIASAQLWDEKARPLLARYCVDCHNADYQEAELDLESRADVQGIVSDRAHWEKILQRIRFATMPPEDSEQPSDAERTELVNAIEAILYGGVCDLTPKPGRVTVRRLNRSEYNNTIRDIFGHDLRPADEFPSDEVGAGFDNNGDVLSLPPMLFEKYMAAAEKVAAAVILDPDTVEKIDQERSSDTLHSIGQRWTGSFYKFYMAEGGVVWASFKTPYNGEYDFRVAGSSGKKDEEVLLGIYNLSGELLEKVTLRYSDGGDSNSQSFRLNLPAGDHRFFVARIENPEAPTETLDAALNLSEEEIQAAWAAEGKPLQVDGNFDRSMVSFAIKSLTMRGPRGLPEELLPPAHHQLIRGQPGKNRSVAEVARPALAWLLRRTFRGPVDDETIDRYVDLVERANKREESFARAMRVAVAAALVSPRFLFRLEVPPGEVAPGESIPVTAHQIASRLSYFLWSSTPDDTLLDLADSGKLTEPEVLAAQVKRMLEDKKSEVLADNFAAQWLGLRNLSTIQPDPTQFVEFSPALRDAMREETRLLFLDILRNNRSVLDFLDTDQSYLNQALAKLYGIPGVEGDEYRLVSIADTPRRGILTHASVLALTSNPTRTSPVKRGKWILENILGTPPPEPPAGVPELEATKTADPNATLREQLEVHRADPSCASCHRTMDDLGFGFENFDVIGSYRDLDRNSPIDSAGELPGGISFRGPVELIGILRDRYGSQFVRTTTQRLLTFALGRELRFEDRCVVDEIVRTVQDRDYRFQDLITEVVLSTAFRFQQPEGT